MLDQLNTSSTRTSRNLRVKGPVRARGLWKEAPADRPEVRCRAARQSSVEKEIRGDSSFLDQHPVGRRVENADADHWLPENEEEAEAEVEVRQPRRVQLERAAASRTRFLLLLPATVVLVIWTVKLLAS